MEEDLVRGGPAGWTFASASSGMPGVCSSPWISESWQEEASVRFFLLPPRELLQRTHTHASNCSSLLLASDSFIKPLPPLYPAPVSTVHNQVYFILFCFNNLICVIK